MSLRRRSFLQALAASAPLPFLSGCRGFIENLDTSAAAEGTGFQGSAFFLSYRIVRVRPYGDYRGNRPVVTPIVVRQLKAEQIRLEKAAAQGRREIPGTRRNAVRARARAQAHTAKAQSQSDPAKRVSLERQAAEEAANATRLEQQANQFDLKIENLLSAANAEIGTILADDALHEVHIPTGTLTETVYVTPDEVVASGAKDLVVQSDDGFHPVIDGRPN